MWNLILKILDYIAKIIILPTILWGGYLYIENRKLKSFKFEKEAKIKQAEIKELDIQKRRVRTELFFEPFDRNRKEEDFECKIQKKKAELEYYEKMKRYKWIFSK